MPFQFKPMTEEDAQAIVNWHYEGIYAFYDMEQDAADMEEFLDARNWPDSYYAVVDEVGEVVGFFVFEPEGQEVVLGLGLRPDCTGQGWGQAFVEAGLGFARVKYHPARFRLHVAAFNSRAIWVYEKAGFKPDGTYMNRTNGGEYEFLQMVRQG